MTKATVAMPMERTDMQQADRSEGRCVHRQTPRTLDAVRIFAGGREVRVIYGSEEYRLRITRNDKLILTK